ncbi:pyridoxal-phosphate dependent enzyme [Cognatiyoonia sp.]|uniref:pyridoxal-phosphate dependent enzyme n=1 Tax=Cognatiyoonia sp. TaxID=2211652 RepID=UPI003F69F3F7
MPKAIKNTWRGIGLSLNAPMPCDDNAGAAKLLGQCPAYAPTPLTSVPELADRLGVASVLMKDERARMGLGSFKALGAAHAIAREAAATKPDDWSTALAGRTFATASAGNHGISVAAGARIFGAQAVIYLSKTVPEPFAQRLRKMGAEVVRAGSQYEESMDAALKAAEESGWTLLSDSSWDGYTDLPYRVMEGYLQLAAETADEMDQAPTHIMLQAGVGGLAAAIAAYARRRWGDTPEIIVVEPEAAPALMESIRAGELVESTGPVSSMGRLDCKTASLIALNGLARDADQFVIINEDEAEEAMPILASMGLETTPSGGAGLTALLAGLPLPEDARVWAILSEGPEDA